MSVDHRSASGPTHGEARRTNTLSAEHLLDEYRIAAILGAGGFGITYKALDVQLNAWVAIKEYFPVEWSFRDADGVSVHPNTQGLSASNGEITDYEWGLERFLDEARVLAQVQHPYVVRIKRYFRANGTAYIVMDYEDGLPLSTILQENETLPEEEVRGLLEDVLPALRAVHEQGYLHRDIKPANLYVRSRDQRVMLIDFGAARMAVGQRSQNVTSLVTPGYSPPEQYTTRNDRYGAWTDIYALGAVLYRCVTGRAPTEAAERLLDDHLEPAAVVGVGRYSTNLLRAIDRALTVRPEARFQDVAEMRAALDGSADDENDETVIVAPVVKSAKSAPGPAARAVSPQPPAKPTLPLESEQNWLEITQVAPIVDLPAAGRSDAGRRRVPVGILGGGMVGLLSLAVLAWLWPSTPVVKTPPAPGVGAASSRTPVQPTAQPPVAARPVAPIAADPAKATAPVAVDSAAASAPPPVTAPVVETAPAAPVVEVKTPTPAKEPLAPATPAPSVQPVPFQDETATTRPTTFQEERAVTDKPPAVAAPAASAPALTSGETKARSERGAERVPIRQTRKAPPPRETRSARSRISRSRAERDRSSLPPPPQEPAPVQRAPVRTGNPWDAPSSTGFNQK